MKSDASSVEAYLASLPEGRRAALEQIRAVINKNLSPGFEEGMQYGMIGYYVPHSVYPAGYHCDPKQPLPFASVASQKNHMAVYLMCIYSDAKQEAWFRKAWAKTGKKLDMGKSCIRFKKIEDVPLEVIGEAIQRVPASKFIAHYESVFAKKAKTSKSAKESKGSKVKPAQKSKKAKAEKKEKGSKKKKPPKKK